MSRVHAPILRVSPDSQNNYGDLVSDISEPGIYVVPSGWIGLVSCYSHNIRGSAAIRAICHRYRSREIIYIEITLNEFAKELVKRGVEYAILTAEHTDLFHKKRPSFNGMLGSTVYFPREEHAIQFGLVLNYWNS